MRPHMKTHALSVLIGLASSFCLSYGFLPSTAPPLFRKTSTTSAMSMARDGAPARSRIENAIALAVATSVVAINAASLPAAFAEELPAGTNPFTSICMGFGCGEFQGLDYPGAPAPTDEDSITFKSFLESLDKGLVAKVDFLAGGNKAYAFVKPSETGEPKRIRIGEGYPDEQSKGWSSPLWVVRALNDRKVPYQFQYDLGPGRATQKVAK